MRKEPWVLICLRKIGCNGTELACTWRLGAGFLGCFRRSGVHEIMLILYLDIGTATSPVN